MELQPALQPVAQRNYARLVSIVKAPLWRVLRTSLLSVEVLSTVLAEVEQLVYSRPLTYVGDHDDPAPLSPNMLLGSQIGRTDIQEIGLDHEAANRRVQYLIQLQQDFTKRWVMEYLTALRTHNQNRRSPITIGDIVLLSEGSKKRQNWRLARLVKVTFTSIIWTLPSFPGNTWYFRERMVTFKLYELFSAHHQECPILPIAVLLGKFSRMRNFIPDFKNRNSWAGRGQRARRSSRAQPLAEPDLSGQRCCKLRLKLQLGTVKLSRWRHWLNFIKTNGAAPRAAKSALPRRLWRSRLYVLATSPTLKKFWVARAFEVRWACTCCNERAGFAMRLTVHT